MIDLKSEKLTFDDNTAKSSNLEQGYEKTKVTNDDIKVYKKFIKKVPNNILEKIKFLNDYDPSKIHNLKL